MSQQYEPGRTVLGRYVIEGLLGQGGMGAVYVAHHAELARKRFAIKTLRADLFGHSGVEERFRREAEVLAALDHPGIVSIVDFGMDGATPVMVMELLQGETVRDRLSRTGPFPLAEVVRLVREVASALDVTHHCAPPVIHRDLKPENLFFVQPDGRLKVLDYGIAKVDGGNMHLTQGSVALGTPHYMSPEQLRDASRVDPSTDVFALASIAYECLAGALAFPGEGIGAVVFAMFDGERPRPTRVRRDVPDAVDGVLARAWAVDRTQRFRSAGEFAHAFAAAAGMPQSASVHPPPEMFRTNALPQTAFAPTPSTNPGTTAPTVARAHRKSATVPLIAGAVVALLAIAGGLGLAYTAYESPSPAAPAAPGASRTTPATTVSPIPRGEPVIPGASRGAGNDLVAPANGRAGGATVLAPTNAQDPFDAAQASMAQPIRACASGSLGARRLGLRITWSGQLGYPQNVALDQHVPSRVQTCISRAVATYGRVPPQSTATVTRRFTFEM